MYDLLVIGGGPAGLTAATYARRAGKSVLVLEKAAFGGQITWSPKVENFPGFPDGVNGYELMMKLQTQAEKFGSRIEIATVEKLQLSDGGEQTVFLDSGKVISSQSLIVATGAAPRWLGLESEERLKNCGVSACATCDGAFFADMDVVVAGGADSAMYYCECGKVDHDTIKWNVEVPAVHETP